MTELLVMNVTFGLLFVALSRHLNGTWINGVNLFWVSWLVLLGACQQAMEADPSLMLPETSVYFVKLAFYGAAVGSVVGIFLAGRRDSEEFLKVYLQLKSQTDFLLKYLAPIFIFAMLSLGSAHFVQRWNSVDYDLLRIYEVRVNFLDEGFSVLSRLSSYVAMLGFFVMMLQGTSDASGKPRIAKVILMWLANAPHGLAFAGRGWTVAPLLIYLFAYALTRQMLPANKRGPLPYSLSAFLLLGLWTFVVLGALRVPDRRESMTEVMSPGDWSSGEKNMVANWLGSSLIAVGPHSEFVASLEPTWGDATFEYFTGKAESWGLISRRPIRDWAEWVTTDLMRMPDVGFVWCIPPTVIPYLVFDYGTYGMPFVLGLMIALLHWFIARFSGRSIFFQFASFAALNTVFSTIQGLHIFAAVNVVPLIITGGAQVAIDYVRGLLFKSKRRAGNTPSSVSLAPLQSKDA